MTNPSNSAPSVPKSLKGISILGICASGVASESRFAIDPEYQRRVELAGGTVSQAYYEQITADLLEAHDLVILTGYPKTDALEYAHRILAEKAPLIRAYVRNGGGLLVFVDDHYARLFEPLNAFLAEYGVEVLCEQLFDSNRANAGELPTSPEIPTLLTRNLSKAHEITRGMESLVLPNGWQAGAWPLKWHSDEWTALVMGEKTVESRVLWQEQTGTYPAVPPLCGVRPFGSGRVGIFPVHPTFFVSNGYHRRWGGYFLNEAGNALFLDRLVHWLGSVHAEARNIPAWPVCLINRDQTMEWFQSIPAEEQPLSFPVHKGLFGVRSNLSNGSHGVAELCQAAREAGFAWVVFTEHEEELRPEAWTTLAAECEKATCNGFCALPGVDFAARNDYGNRGVVVLPRYWPRKQENLRFIIQMIEEGGGMLVFSNPSSCPLPPWNNGGFQAMEVVRYDAAGKPEESAFDLFKRLQSHDWSLVPIARHDASTPEEILRLGQKPGVMHTYIRAPRPEDVAAYIPRIECMEHQEVFISSGPLIHGFWMSGPGCIKDVWEGRYYVWSSHCDEEVNIVMDCASAAPLASVTLFDNGEVFARYCPKTAVWRHAAVKANDRICRSFWIEVRDVDGHTALSSARRVRNNRFQAHGGGDRMNTYGAVYFPHPQGEFTLLGERCSSSGTMLFGQGWRSHHLNIYPPVAASEYHPEGGEWGAPAGRLERVYLNPVIQSTEGVEIERPLENRVGFDSAGQEVAILDDQVEAFESILPGTTLAGYVPHARVHLDKCTPGETIRKETELIAAATRHTFGRWRPDGGPIIDRMDLTVTAKKELTIAESGELSLRVLKLETDLDRFIQALHFSTAEGHQSLPVTSDWQECSLSRNGFAAMTEQPYGSFGIMQLAGEPLSVRFEKVAKICEMHVGMRIAPGTCFPKGHTWKISLALVVTGNPKNGDYFAALHSAFWEDAARRWNIKTGRLGLQSVYPAQLEANGWAVEFGREESAGLESAGVDELVEITGLNPEWSAFAFVGAAHDGIPLTRQGRSAFWTLPTGRVEAVAGHPIIADHEDLRIEVTATGDRFKVRAQNPTGHRIRGYVFANPHFYAIIPGWKNPLDLEPGGEALFEISL